MKSILDNIVIGPRPGRFRVEELKSQGVTVIVTLETSRTEEISSICEEIGLKWVNIPLEGANQAYFSKKKTQNIIMKGICTVKSLLETDKLYIHCAAGIHRTGTFCYILLRKLGFTPEEALNSIKSLREITYQKVGDWRIKAAESII